MKILFNLIFSYLIVHFSPLLGASLPAPFHSIKVLPEYRFGYYTNAEQIAEIFRKNQIQTVIEIGSWIGGGSTAHFAELLKPVQGKVYAIDTWLGSSTQQQGGPHYQPVLPYVYQQFLSNMIHWNLTDTVIPVRMRSLEAAQALNVQPDLIYIDGEHTEQAVYDDLKAWYPYVQEKGILCGDDWSWLSVRVAVEKFAAENGLQIEASGNFWRLK